MPLFVRPCYGRCCRFQDYTSGVAVPVAVSVGPGGVVSVAAGVLVAGGGGSGDDVGVSAGAPTVALGVI